jgi:hypothetical protein
MFKGMERFVERGPVLDQLYTRLKRCGDLSCTGKPFTEHRNVVDLTINTHDSRPAWQQVSETLAAATSRRSASSSTASAVESACRAADEVASGQRAGTPRRGGGLRNHSSGPG